MITSNLIYNQNKIKINPNYSDVIEIQIIVSSFPNGNIKYIGDNEYTIKEIFKTYVCVKILF